LFPILSQLQQKCVHVCADGKIDQSDTSVYGIGFNAYT